MDRWWYQHLNKNLTSVKQRSLPGACFFQLCIVMLTGRKCRSQLGRAFSAFLRPLFKASTCSWGKGNCWPALQPFLIWHWIPKVTKQGPREKDRVRMELKPWNSCSHCSRWGLSPPGAHLLVLFHGLALTLRQGLEAATDSTDKPATSRVSGSTWQTCSLRVISKMLPETITTTQLALPSRKFEARSQADLWTPPSYPGVTHHKLKP